MDRKKIFWAIASVFIAILSIWTVVSQSKHFSFEILMSFIRNANKGWLFMSFVCTFGFIWFEGFALVRMARHFGYKTSAIDGTVYGGADVYFSAITPSASGGQPASAYFMIRDGIPGYAATVALLINLVMYTLSLLTIGVLCMIFMAVGEGVNKAVDVSVIQCFVAMGSNCVPIPGAMGVADYIMIDGFKQLVGRNAANMELLCRGMTFYGSVITSAVIILIGYIIRKKVAK